jgi:peptide/nickel transport system substrate-binding protein
MTHGNKLRRWLVVWVVGLLSVGVAGVASPAPARDTLVVAAGVQFVTFDPMADSHTVGGNVEIHVMEQLIDRNPLRIGQFVPRLAESWRNDGNVWTLTLRRGVKFHDGTPFNAAAVKANFDRMMDRSLGFGKTSRWAHIEEVRVTGEYEVQITTKQPDGAFLNKLTDSSGKMISPAAIRQLGRGIATSPVGTGPYRFQTPWAPGQDIVLVRNDDYWGPKPKIARIIFKEVREPLTRQALLQRGEVDLVVDLPAEAIPRFRSDPNFVVRQDPGFSGLLVFNNGKGPFANRLVRQAFNYAIDIRAIIKGVLGGFASPVDNLVGPEVVGYTPDPDYNRYDPSKARELLAAAGYKNGFEARLITPVGRYPKDKEAMVAIQDQVRKVGIRLDVVPTEWTTFLASIRPQSTDADVKWDAYYWSRTAYTGDPQNLMQELLHSAYAPPRGFTPFYKNPEVDKLIEQAGYVTDRNVRIKILERALRLARQDYAYLYLWRYQNMTVHSKRVTGIEFGDFNSLLFSNAVLR